MNINSSQAVQISLLDSNSPLKLVPPFTGLPAFVGVKWQRDCNFV